LSAAWTVVSGVAPAEGDLRVVVEAAARGDQPAFKQLYQQHARSVYNLVFRCMRNAQSSEDVCQEIWVKAYRELPKLAEPQAFPAWLYRIAARACVDAARKNSRVPASSELLEERTPALEDDPEQSALQRERIRLTWEALSVLPARQHLALYLREMERRSYKEIAQMLETSDAAVETLLFRARQGFVTAYERLEAAAGDRCEQAQQTMAAVMDGEATPVQQKAVRAHVDACRPCSGQLGRMQRASAAYAALAPLPVPALLGERIFDAIGVSGSGAAAAPGGITKAIALAGVKAKIFTFAVVATGSLTVAAMTTPVVDEIRPGPAGPAAEMRADDAAGGSADGAAGVEVTGADQAANAPEPGLVGGTTGTVNDLTSSTLTTVDETVAGLTGTVDGIVNEITADVAGVAPIPAITVEADVVPTPEAPLPTVPPGAPTPPPLPGLP